MKKKLILAAVILPLLIFALTRLDWQGVRESMRQLPVWVVALLVMLQVVSQLLVNTLWHSVANAANVKISFWQMFYVNCQGAVIDSITPGVKFGGEVTRAVQLAKTAGCETAQAASIVAVQKLFSLSALFFVLVLVAAFFVGGIAMPIILAGLLAVFLVVLAVPHRLLHRINTQKPGKSTKLYQIKLFAAAMLGHICIIRKKPLRLVGLFLLALFIWVLYPVKLYIIVVQFMPVMPLLQVGAIAFMAYMVAMLPIFPGGLGGFEGTAVGLIMAAGMVTENATVVTVLFRFITFWLVMLASLVVVMAKKLVVKISS